MEGINCSMKMRSEKIAVVDFNKNPLDDNVKLPKQLKGLEYSNIICGIIRGSLEAVILYWLIHDLYISIRIYEYMYLFIYESVNYIRLSRMRDVQNKHQITQKYESCDPHSIHLKPNYHSQNDKTLPTKSRLRRNLYCQFFRIITNLRSISK